MPTNDERREVAARLRDFDSLRETFQASNICAFLDVLGVDGYLGWKDICDRLADLIEPHYGLVSVIVDEDDICLECGEPLTENANYCAMCGKEVANAD